MRIARVKVEPVVQPMVDPTWEFALGNVQTMHGFVIRIDTEEGLTGWGYTTALPHLGASPEIVRAGLDNLAPLLVGKEGFAIESILAELDRALPGNLPAKAGIDIGLHDLAASSLKVPLYSLLGGPCRREIPLLAIVPLKEPPLMARKAADLVERGYRHLKIKVGTEPGLDLRRVRAVREAVGPDILLTVDANQGYQPKTAIDALRRMEEFGILLAEQPVPAADLEGLRMVTEAVSCQVEADESAQTLDEVASIARMGAADAISIKLIKMGGISKARKIAALCQAHHLGCRVGASFGSRMLAAACMHFIAATPNIDFACEVGEFTELLEDPATGLEVENGILRVPEGAGLGVTISRRDAE